MHRLCGVVGCLILVLEKCLDEEEYVLYDLGECIDCSENTMWTHS